MKNLLIVFKKHCFFDPREANSEPPLATLKKWEKEREKEKGKRKEKKRKEKEKKTKKRKERKHKKI